MINNIDKTIRVLIELPTWLGDCVMSTPAIENIISHYKNIEITIIGPVSSIEIIKHNPNVFKTIILDHKFKTFFELKNKLDDYDVFFTFRASVRAKFLKFFVRATAKYQFNHKNYPNCHQVEKYVGFVNDALCSNYPAGKLSNYFSNRSKPKNSKLIGINPGASYGSAKRWYPEQFAKIALAFSDEFDIILFGGVNEINFAKKIEAELLENNVHNYVNLSGKTSILELNNYISTLDIFVTGDSGPMHIAASLDIPTIAIFGPTNPLETSQWMCANSQIIKKDLACQPCMKKTCPLEHHNCMKLIKAEDVIESISSTLS